MQEGYKFIVTFKSYLICCVMLRYVTLRHVTLWSCHVILLLFYSQQVINFKYLGWKISYENEKGHANKNCKICSNFGKFKQHFNPLHAELNPICHLLALLGAHLILHVSRIRVKSNRVQNFSRI